MNPRRFAIGALGALTACLGTATTVSHIGSGPGPDSGTPSWASSLNAPSDAVATYAIVDDEQGPYFAIMDIASSSTGAAACAAELASTSSQVPTGQWTLELAVPATPGQYAVLSAQGDPIYPNIGGGGSVVRLVLLESGGSALQMYPVSGSVTITSGPSSASLELVGERLRGSYHLGFAAEPLQGNCSYGSASYDLGLQVIGSDYVCSCETPEGKTVSTCDGGGGNFDGCCYQAAPVAFTLDGDLDATPCPGLCVAPLGLAKACHPLCPDAGGP
jgi:hypothetical protein